MSLVAYVSEDGLVGHQWEERPLVLRRLYALVQNMSGPGREQEWVGLVAVSWEGIGGFVDSM